MPDRWRSLIVIPLIDTKPAEVNNRGIADRFRDAVLKALDDLLHEVGV